MSEEDRVLFSQYFYLRNDVSDSKDCYDNILKFIVNIKEVNDSPLKISTQKMNSEILGLVVEPISSYKSRFSMMYSVSDGITHENRTMEGVIVVSEESMLLEGNISRFNENGFNGSCEIIEYFSMKDENYMRYYNYTGTEYFKVEYINSADLKKVDEFKEETVKLMKSRKN